MSELLNALFKANDSGIYVEFQKHINRRRINFIKLSKNGKRYSVNHEIINDEETFIIIIINKAVKQILDEEEKNHN